MESGSGRREFHCSELYSKLDPNVGTDNPGVAEHYKVLPNKYKGENGTYVEGRGRIYFRMGVTGKMPERLLGMLK